MLHVGLLALAVCLLSPSLPWDGRAGRQVSGVYAALLCWYPELKQTRPQAASLRPEAMLSNGTHQWRRTVLMISVDGLKPKYLRESHMPFLRSLGLGTLKGVGKDVAVLPDSTGSLLAEGMQPRFPTLTFPNHWSLLTGLNAESHGIIANDFLMPPRVERADAPLANKTFYYSDPSRSWNAAWWKGDPIWALSERAGVSSAVMMWPGPPTTTEGDRPSIFQKYESDWTLQQKRSRLAEWFDLDLDRPGQRRPQLICAYLPDVDKSAHSLGPDAQQTLDVVARVDEFLSSVYDLIRSRNATHIVDLIIVSDHGMTTTSNERLVYLDDEAVLGRELFSQVKSMDGWPLAGFHFEGTVEEQRSRLQEAERRLRAAARTHGGGQAFDVYIRKELPGRWHLRHNSRVAPLWVIPRIGWCLTHQQEMAAFGGVYQPIGNHGYDNTEDDMQAVFVSSGPSFKRRLSATREADWNMRSFPNTEVHNLVARLLGIPEAIQTSNNGTDGFWDPYLSAEVTRLAASS